MQYETFEEAFSRALESGEDSFSFNDCNICIKEYNTLEKAFDYYIHNVDLSQFEGWK